MYRNEAAFKKALLGALRKHGIMCTCVETGCTSQGVPDVYVMGWAWHGDTWLELKNMPKDSIKQEKWKIPWRPGQQAWACEYYTRHMRALYTLTICSLSDGFLIIPMNGMYKDNVVDRRASMVGVYQQLGEVVDKLTERLVS